MSGVFEGLPASPVTSYLENVLATGNVAHAYLLAGRGACGKEDIALRFAAALVAPDDAGQFALARRMAHPDVHLVQPGGTQDYLVEETRALTRDVALAPVRAARKVYVLTHVERLGASAANAFLKTLEEPPESVVFVLLAEHAPAVLETVRSRCEVLAFPEGDAAPAQNPELFSMLDAVAAGCGNRELLAHAKRFVEMAGAGGADVQRGREEELERYAEFLSSQAAKKHGEATERLVKAARRDELVSQLDIVQLWLRDCLVVAQGASGLACYADELRHTALVAGASTPRGLHAALTAVDSCRERISYNVMPQLAVEAMFLEIREALCQR